jgi:hypothetical protein
LACDTKNLINRRNLVFEVINSPSTYLLFDYLISSNKST